MTSTRSTTRRLLVAAAVAVVAVTASGCSSGGIDAGAAAIVGDRRISVADVQTATAELNMLPGLQSALPQREVLSSLIAEPFYVQAAADKGNGVSENEAVTFLSQAKWVNTRTGSTTPAQPTVDFVRAFLAQRTLLPQQDGSGPSTQDAIKSLQEISARLKQTRIRVNPRYGTLQKNFDPAGRGIFPVDPANPNWLVAPPAATATAPVPTPAAS